MLNKILKNRALAGLLIGIIIAIATSFLIFANPLQNIHLKLADKLYTKNGPSDDIVIIAIDENSTSKPPKGLGRYAQWSRDNFTKLLEKLQLAGPKVIAFDVVFNNHTQALPLTDLYQFQKNTQKIATNKEKLDAYEKFFQENSNPLQNAIDERFANKLAEFDNVILAISDSPTLAALPLQKFSEKAHLAAINIFLDDDGVFRRMHDEFQQKYPSLAVQAARLFKRDQEISVPENMMVNYFADPFNYRMIPFADIINGNPSPEELSTIFKDKIALIGVTSFKELQDDVLTPRSNKMPMPGVETWANQIQTILDDKFLREETLFEQTAANVVMALGLTTALNFLSIIFSTGLIIALFAGYIFLAHFFYRQGIILNMIYPFLTFAVIFIASWIYKYFVSDRKKRQIKEAFSRYVSSDLVEQIADNPDMVKLGGEKKIITVFFSDIEHSTDIAEKSKIEEWVSQVNEYFTAMEKIIKKSGGTVDKYEGDAIMAFWNAPLSQEDHVVRAYESTLQMKKTLYELNHNWQQIGRPALNIRIGINTGEALVGNFGSEERFDYTAMGDTVNTASRLEGYANKTYGTSVTVAGIDAGTGLFEKFLTRELDIVYLPGKKEPVKIYELICAVGEATDDLKNLVGIYQEGMKNYRSSNWQDAIKKFESLPNDKPSQILLARCSALLQGGKVAGLGDDMVFGIFK